MHEPISSEATADNSQSIAKLLEDLNQHDWPTNTRAADALAKIGDPAVPAILRALQSDDGFVRNGAAIALGKIGNRAAVRPLLQALQRHDDPPSDDDEHTEARISAAIALGKLGDPDACQPLLDELEKVLKADLTLASYIIEALGEIANPRAVIVLARLVEFGNFDIQKLSSWALARMGPSGVEILVGMAGERARQGRQFVVRALGGSGNALAIPVLITIARDRNDDKLVRGEAARALGRFGNPSDVMPLLTAILADPDEDIRSSALHALGFLRDPAAFETITKHVHSGDLGYVAVMALGDLGDARACALLIPMLKGQDFSLRCHAATALGKLGCREAVPALVEALERYDDSPLSGVEKAAIETALKRIQSMAGEH